LKEESLVGSLFNVEVEVDVLSICFRFRKKMPSFIDKNNLQSVAELAVIVCIYSNAHSNKDRFG
jgi:hypothetical protein